MLRSMTGFGRGDILEKDRRFRIEIKAVNHRYFDFSLKAPRFLYAFEDRIRKRIMQEVSRGKIEVWISFESNSPQDFSVHVNELYADAYKDALERLCEKFGLGDASRQINLSILLRAPDILVFDKFEAAMEDESNREEIWETLKIALDTAIDNFNKMRLAEGKALADDILGNRESALKLIDQIKGLLPQFIESNAIKLKNRLSDLCSKLSANLDEDRLISEIAILADKSDISEELARLFSHFEQLWVMLQEENAVGRKVDFMVQEMNREANTIGAKSHASELTSLAVELKSVIEKIREQAQNIE